jgi:phosphatidate cytidylyltransferase
MKRIITALILIPTIAWVILKAPHSVFMAVLTITGLLAYHEFDQIAGANGIRKAGWIGMAAGLAVLFVPDPGVLLVLIAMLGMTLAMQVENLRASMPAAGAFVLGIVYIFGSWHTVDLLRQINPHWAMFAMLLSWAGDTAALYVGKAFGKHKMSPRVSPAKTWEGAAGSVGGAMLVGLVYGYYLMPGESFAVVAGIAIAGNIAGQLGDLCESALKRGAGVKDSGTLLPGHGGWLDRIDASLFSVPMVYALVVMKKGGGL